MVKLEKRDILSLVGIEVGNIVEWPRDILSLCEFADIYNTEPGIVYLSHIKRGKISFSGLLSKGKPPNRRTECIMFEMGSFEPYYVRKINVGKKVYYEILSVKGHWFTSAKNIEKVFFRDSKISDTMPAICAFGTEEEVTEV